jgi:hypothetical protein
MSDDQLTPAPLVRRAARGGANVLVLVAALIPVWFIAAPVLAVSASAALGLIKFFIAIFVLWLLGDALFERCCGVVVRVLLRWRLRRQLRVLLRAHGIDPRDHSDARRKLERGFWRGQQRAALVALCLRFAGEPPRLDLYEATILQLRASTFAIACAAGVGALSTVSVAFVSYHAGDVWFGVRLTLTIWLAITLGAIFMTGWDGLRKQRATMAELAGGLSLAEHEIDEALRGALSDDVAQPGALSAIARGVDA